MTTSNIFTFLLNPPSELKYITKLYDFVTRSGIMRTIHSTSTDIIFTIPTEQMVNHLLELNKSKNFIKLESCILSLFLIGKMSEITKPVYLKTLTGNTVAIKPLGKKEVMIENAKATVYKNMLKMNSSEFVLGEKRKITTVEKKGAFENKEKPQGLEKKFADMATRYFEKPNGIKALVANIYASLSDENKKIADCFMSGNPFAEYFLLLDSKFITVNYEETIKNSSNTPYDEIISIRTEYCIDIDELKGKIQYTTFMENNYKLFYEQVAENKGTFTIDGKTYKICHPAIAEYLYSIEMFYYCMSKLGKEFENSSLAEKSAIFSKMIEINNLTDVKSTHHAIFNDTANPIINFEEFSNKFSTFGLCICRNIKKTASWEDSKKMKIKSKNRKQQKQKHFVSLKKKMET